MSTSYQAGPAIRHNVEVDGVRLAAWTRGDPTYPPVVLVHGYPDTSAVWNPVAERLAQDFYVVTYDVRGAGASHRPPRISDYALDKLSADLVALLDALLPGRAVHLVGHDWGSIQTWESVTSAHLQDRILSYTTISGPCLDHAGHWFRKALQPNATHRKLVLGQLAKSWYIAAFQLPLLAGTVWRGLGAFWPQIMKLSENIEVAPTTTQTSDGTFGVNLYRANMLARLLKPRERRTDKPIQLIVALHDNFMHPRLFEDITHWAPNTWRREVATGHWGLVHEGESLAGWIRAFIRQVETGQPAEGLSRA